MHNASHWRPRRQIAERQAVLAMTGKVHSMGTEAFGVFDFGLDEWQEGRARRLHGQLPFADGVA